MVPLDMTHMFLSSKEARTMGRHGLTEVPEYKVIRDATLLYDFVSSFIMPVMSVKVSSACTGY